MATIEQRLEDIESEFFSSYDIGHGGSYQLIFTESGSSEPVHQGTHFTLRDGAYPSYGPKTRLKQALDALRRRLCTGSGKHLKVGLRGPGPRTLKGLTNEKTQLATLRKRGHERVDRKHFRRATERLAGTIADDFDQFMTCLGEEAFLYDEVVAKLVLRELTKHLGKDVVRTAANRL